MHSSATNHGGIIGAAQAARFRNDGYVVIPGVFDAAACEILCGEMWKLMPEGFEPDDERTWHGRIQDCCTFLPVYQRKGLVRFKDKKGFARNPAIKSLIYDNPAIGRLFSALAGAPFERCSIRGLHPNLPMPRWVSINEALGNRVDPQLTKPERPLLKIPCPPQMPIFGHLDVHSFECGMMAYLNDVAEDGGALAVWPGSHRLFDLAFEASFDFLPTGLYKRALNLLQRYRPKMVAAKAGDVIIFHNRLLHANTVNRTRQIRYGVLLDLFGKSWRERDVATRGQQPRAGSRKRLNGVKWIEQEPIVQAVLAGYARDPIRDFWARRPRLRAAVHKISQDPTADARRGVSAKIRARAAGDCWIVISQGDDFKRSWKLDAYGSPQLGDYGLRLNGVAVGRSGGGVLVERLALAAGENQIEIEGRFGADHHVRVIRTANPMPDSEILFCGTIEKGRASLRASFLPESRREPQPAVASAAGR